MIRNEKMGKNVEIYDPVNLYDCIIGNNTKIGVGTEIGKNVIIGENCKIQAQCFIPQGVVILHNCMIAPCVCFTNDKYPAVSGWNDERVGKTIVEEDVSIGANSTILPNIIIGKGSLIGAGSIVTKDIPPNSIAYGNPCRVIKKRGKQ